jgi:hypothetical protein
MDRQPSINNIVGASKTAVAYRLPIVHSTVNGKTGLNNPPIHQIRKVLDKVPTIDRTTINSGTTSNCIRPWRRPDAET